MARKVAGVTGGSGKWYASAYDPKTERKVRVKNPATGRTVFPSQQAAIDAKEAFERTKEAPRARAWTADQWVEEWTSNPGYLRKAKSTNEHNAERVKQFAKDFAGVLLADIDRPTARKWATENNGRLMAVRAMFTDAVNDGIVPTNPFAGLRMEQSNGRKDIEVLTNEEVGVLRHVAYQAFPDWPVLGALISTAAYAGLRLGELCALAWEDVDWENGTLSVNWQWRGKQQEYARPKSGKARTVVLLGPAADALRGVPREGPVEQRERGKPSEQLVFYTKRDRSRYSSSIHPYYWAQVRAAFWASLPAGRQAKIDQQFDFHELRHFCGSYLGDLGLSARDIALQLGHTDGGRLAQELYIHTYEDNAMARIRQAFVDGQQSRRAS